MGSEGGAGEKWTESGSTTWWKHLPVTWVGLMGHKGKAKIRYFLGVCLEPLGAPCVLLRCAILIKAGVW